MTITLALIFLLRAERLMGLCNRKEGRKEVEGLWDYQPLTVTCFLLCLYGNKQQKLKMVTSGFKSVIQSLNQKQTRNRDSVPENISYQLFSLFLNFVMLNI